jgi:hypothetical protein
LVHRSNFPGHRISTLRRFRSHRSLLRPAPRAAMMSQGRQGLPARMLRTAHSRPRGRCPSRARAALPCASAIASTAPARRKSWPIVRHSSSPNSTDRNRVDRLPVFPRSVKKAWPLTAHANCEARRARHPQERSSPSATR